MKKSKLNLKKFKISKLNNLNLIRGGNGGTDGTIIISKGGRKEKCVDMSDRWIVVK